jgi:hypothetical protein
MSRFVPRREASVTFKQFVSTAGSDAGVLQANYETASLSAAQRILLDRIDEPLDVLAIIDGSRRDVVAGLPIIARIADETGAIRLRVRGNNPVAARYLIESGGRTPIYVFSTDEHGELAVLVAPRPEIDSLVKAITDIARTRVPALV